MKKKTISVSHIKYDNRCNGGKFLPLTKQAFNLEVHMGLHLKPMNLKLDFLFSFFFSPSMSIRSRR